MNMTSIGSRKSPERILGLTGGIASGKSTVSALFTELGAQVICADELARQVVRPGAPALAEIASVFGAAYLTQSGELDRKRMGERVFAEPAARRQLEAILHPRIRQAFVDRVTALRRDDPQGVIVYDAPLLLEVGADREVAKVLVVDVDRSTQIARLVVRDGLTEAEAAQRIDAQMAAKERLARADEVLDGTAPAIVLKSRLAAIMAAL